MRPSSGQETCECCKDDSNLVFCKILEKEDVGVAIYHYLPQAENENQKDTINGQVFVLQNTGDGDVNLEELILESGKKKVSCPRCMKRIQHVKHLLKELPPVNIREVTSICEHCYQRQISNCPCCKTIVDKFLKFRCEETNQTEEERERYKSWLIKTQLSLKKTFSNAKGSKVETYILPEGTRSGGRIQDSEIPASRLKGESELLHEEKKYQLVDEILEKPLKIISFLDFPKEDIKPEPKKEKTGILKSRDDVIDEIKKPLVSLPTHYSFETVMKSLSEPNVSDFCYAFPHEKNLIKRRQISSSEIIKYTQEMLKEREVEEKKKKAELQRLKEDKERLAEEAKRKLEERKEIEYELEVEEEESEERGKTTKRKKQGSEKEIKDYIEGGGALKKKLDKHAKIFTEQETIREQNVRGLALGEKKTREVEKTEERKSKKTIHDSGDGLKKGRKEQDDNSEKLDKKDKSREGKQHDIASTSALKDQVSKKAKEKSEDEKLRKLKTEKKRKDDILDIDDGLKKGGKGKDYKSEKLDNKDKAREEKQHDSAATSALKDQVSKEAKAKSEEEKLRKLTTEKKRKDDILDIDDGLKKGGKGKDYKSEKLDNKDKAREEKQHDSAATSALKDQVSKEARAKSEEEKMRKQQERDVALAEKKAKVTENNDKQLTMENKIKPPELKEDKEKGEKLEKTVKEQKPKDEKPVKEQKPKDTTQSEMAAQLKDQLAKQKQQELEQEKLWKEQQKERELAEKKLQELQLKNAEKEPAIKPPTIPLTPDVISIEEDVLEDILKPEEVTDIIKGQKIYKVQSMKTAVEKQLIFELKQAEEPKQKTDIEKPYYKAAKQFPEHKSKLPEAALKEKNLKPQDPESTKGIIRYTLSDRTFIEKGWTMLPTEKVVRKMNVYRMRPAKPEFDWFEHNKYKREMTYDSGEKLAEFDDNGRGRWYYRTGELALDYYDAEETNAGQRFVVYSTRQPDERGRSHPRTILATFDYSGNGIVFDHTGKIRLKYNQTEGVVLDRSIGPVSHWKWHTLNDPPVLQQVMIDTQMPYKDATILKMGDKNADQKRPDNEEMIAIEFENFLKEKRQKLTQSFKPFQIKMKAMKINENFSVRVLDQASVYLLFRDGTTNLKINLGMVLDHKEIVDTDTAEIGEVSNTLDKLPACTDSIAALQKAVALAQAAERSRVRHERRLKQPQATASVDALRAGCSRPLRTPIVQASLTSCEKMTPKRFKPTCCDLYYSTQL